MEGKKKGLTSNRKTECKVVSKRKKTIRLNVQVSQIFTLVRYKAKRRDRRKISSSIGSFKIKNYRYKI